MRGRPPKPSARHKTVGTFRADRHGSRADLKLPAVADAAPPKWLSKRALAYWRYLFPLVAHGAMSESHKATLAELCEIMSDLVQLNRLQDNARGKDLAALIKAKGKVRDAMMRYCREFGLTPASAASIKLPAANGGNPEKSEAETFFGPKLAG